MNLREFFITQKWWGKLLGAFLGYLIGGPVGALIGILIGNFFDRGLAEHFSNPYWLYHQEKQKQVQHVFLESTFAVMGHIAKADGRVSEQEIQFAKTLMAELDLNHSQKKAAQHYFNNGKNSSFSLIKTLTLLQGTTRNNPELLKLFVDIQYRAALVDGLSVKKQNVMNTLFNYLGLAPLYQQNRFYDDFMNQSTHQQQTNQQRSYSSNQERRYQRYQAPSNMLDHAYAILEISPTANKQDVKRAYRRLMSRNHPDKLSAQGLPKEMIKIATEKTQKIRKAYEKICESKGW